MSLAKRDASPSGGDAKRFREGFGQGFSQVTTQQMAAQVAAARANADAALRGMKGERALSDAPAPAVSSSRIADEVQQSVEVSVSKKLVEYLMTPDHRQLLASECGAEVEWKTQEAKVKLVGSAKACSLGRRCLARVEMHCHWGASQDKVRRLIRRQPNVESVLCRLSPMTVNKLLPAEKRFSQKEKVLTIGKDSKNDVVIQDAALSRQHCVLSFEPSKGSVYVADLSTNGTFLNGIRLPSKKLGKVLLSHGDELLFRDPGTGDSEFGYICNLNDVSVRPETKWGMPQRLLTSEDQAMSKNGTELR